MHPCSVARPERRCHSPSPPCRPSWWRMLPRAAPSLWATAPSARCWSWCATGGRTTRRCATCTTRRLLVRGGPGGSRGAVLGEGRAGVSLAAECSLPLLHDTALLSTSRPAAAHPPPRCALPCRRLPAAEVYGFSSERKMASVLVRRNDVLRLYNKGAAEMVLSHCTAMVDATGQAVPMTEVRLGLGPGGFGWGHGFCIRASVAGVGDRCASALQGGLLHCLPALPAWPAHSSCSSLLMPHCPATCAPAAAA